MQGAVAFEPKWDRRDLNKKIGDFFNSMRLNKKPKKFRVNNNPKYNKEDREILEMMRMYTSQMHGKQPEYRGAFAKHVEDKREDEEEDYF